MKLLWCEKRRGLKDQVKGSSTLKRCTEEEKTHNESEGMPYKASRMELEENLETKEERVQRQWSVTHFRVQPRFQMSIEV